MQILVVSQEFNFHSNNLFKGLIDKRGTCSMSNLPSKVPLLEVMYITAPLYASSVKN
jgi:hypothetical protein